MGEIRSRTKLDARRNKMRAADANGLEDARSGYCTWKGWGEHRFGQFDKLDEACFRAEILPLLPSCSGARVLELGFGNGKVLGWCLANAHYYFGIETNDALLERARAMGVSAYASLHEEGVRALDGSIDCIAAFDVLEHISDDDLPHVFASFKKLLRPAGFVVARFPNGDSPFGRMYQHGDITHRSSIGRLKILQLSSLNGLSVVSYRAPASPTSDLGLAARVSLMIGLGLRRAIEKFFSRLYFSGQPILLTPNAVTVLRNGKN